MAQKEITPTSPNVCSKKKTLSPSTSGNNNVLRNMDIEDLVNGKRRKTFDDNGIHKKKLHLSKVSSHDNKHVLNEIIHSSKCECKGSETDIESKENCSGNVMHGKKCLNYEGRTRSGSSEDFLQIMNKSKVLSGCTLDSKKCLSSAEKSVVQTTCKGKECTETEEVKENIGNYSNLDVESNCSLVRVRTPGTFVHCPELDLAPKSQSTESSVEQRNDKKREESQIKHDDEFDIFSEEWDLEKIVSYDNVSDLDLGKWQRCEVLEVKEEIPGCEKILQLRSLCTEATACCILRGVWSCTKLNPGAIVSVKAHYENSQALWLVDNNDGFLVEYPDLLLSPTGIVGSVSCMRQGVLNYLFSQNAHDVDDNCKVLTLGCLMHELLQQILTQRCESPECIAALVEDIISSSSNVRLLYSSKMSLQEAREELLKIVPNIHKFCNRYSVWGQKILCNTSSSSDCNVWEGKINSVLAVEDNFWIPQLGLKGKVDVTVMATGRNQTQSQLMPVEVKTGAAKNSAEHKGQVILYCLMAKQITPEVDEGLLVYLREGYARKVKVGRPEQRDIIMLRNKLARYLTPSSLSSQESAEKEISLPRPTNNSRVCQWCPQQAICSTFLTTSKQDELFANTEAQSLRTASIEHLSHEHLEYVIRWSNLVWLEESTKPRNSLTDLWSISAAKRELKGRCLSNLEICGLVCFKDVESYIHVFKAKHENAKFDLGCLQLSVGHTVLISTDCRVAIAFGHVVEINSFSVTVDIPRDLSQVCGLYGDSFIIDVYEPQSSLSWILGNLAALLNNKEAASHLRRLVINCESPVFEIGNESPPLTTHTSPFTLNESQHSAVQKALLAHDYLLLKGLPGTGKSTTVAVIIQQFVAQGCSVLLTAHTHSAVDTVLQKLLKLEVPFLRIGSRSRVHEAIHPWTEQNLTKHCTTPQMLENEYNSKPVVAATCLGVKHPLFTRRFFDVCIVDESTQVMQPIVLGPLLHAKKFILVGDPEQLPPLVRNTIASQKGLSECLFTHLLQQGATVCLDLQYRMNKKITDLANDLTYGGELKCATSTVAEATLQLASEKIQGPLPGWLSKALSCEIDDTIVLLNVSTNEIKSSDCTNKEEALLVKRIIEELLKIDADPETIGVMAPYRDQVTFLKSLMKSLPVIEISTVDQYQGRDKDIIIFSSTNYWSTNSSKLDSCILNDKRRLNVAITRARYKLVIIGNLQALQCFEPMKHIINSIASQNIVHVEN